jgi:hypothetical protein
MNLLEFDKVEAEIEIDNSRTDNNQNGMFLISAVTIGSIIFGKHRTSNNLDDNYKMLPV